MTVSNITGFTISVIFVLFLSAIIPFFSLIIPLPFLFYSSKLGLNQGVIIGFVILLVTGILTKIAGILPYGLLTVLVLGSSGLVTSELFRRGYSFSRTIFLSTALTFAAISGMFLIMALSRDMTPVEMIMSELHLSMDNLIEQFEHSGQNQEVITQMKELTDFMMDRFKKTYLSIFIVVTGFMVWLNVVLSKPLFTRKGIEYPDFGPSGIQSAPEHLVWALIAAGFSYLVFKGRIEFLSLNALIVFLVIYAFYGFSILKFFFNRYNMPTWIRRALYIIIVFQEILLLATALLGLFDQWFDFRKINRNRSESD